MACPYGSMLIHLPLCACLSWPPFSFPAPCTSAVTVSTAAAAIAVAAAVSTATAAAAVSTAAATATLLLPLLLLLLRVHAPGPSGHHHSAGARHGARRHPSLPLPRSPAGHHPAQPVGGQGLLPQGPRHCSAGVHIRGVGGAPWCVVCRVCSTLPSMCVGLF